MTRYSNPLPHGQVPGTQGRAAGQQPQHHEPQWPAPETSRTAGRPAPRYADPAAGYAHEPAAPLDDPYAALRPDGYGYTQPQQPSADPYGLAGYTAPQPAQQGYGSRAAQAPAAQQPAYAPAQAADPYAATGYGNAGHAAPPQAHGYGTASPGYAGAAPAPSAQPQAGAYGYATQPAGSGYAASPRADTAYPSLGADSWETQSLGGTPSLAIDARDYGHAYAAQAQGADRGWGAADPYGDPHLGPALGAPGAYPAAQPAQPGAFDQSYAEDEAQYEEEPRRGGWKKAVAVVACMVLIGGVAVVGANSFLGTDTGEQTPVVKGAAGPAKVKPSEPGGKQFAHTDSKIMGRLGEAGSEAADASGVRKVPVVTVGRDGSIQPPAAVEQQPQEETRAVVAVPGLTVIDGLGGPSPARPTGGPAAAPAGQPPVQMITAPGGAKPVVVEPPATPKKRAEIAAADKPAETGAVPTKAKVEAPAKAPAPPPAPRKERVAAAAPAAQATGAGYVAVLASVPASGSSRIDALKQFADMQQKYGAILSNKTPDIREANLGDKGTYHRLLVGPPGSRDAANSVCSQLKAEGYSGCWVTAY